MGLTMTIPAEELRSILYTRQFMQELLDPHRTPKVPKSVRQRAAQCLRHFPFTHKIEAKWKPDIDAFELGIQESQ